MSRLDLLEGAVIGASLAYLLDPANGKSRRRALAARMGRATGAAFDAAVTEVERRAVARTGRTPRVIAVLRSGKGLRGWSFRRVPPTAADSWELPMATVDIDIDQGTVTLRGTFPQDDGIPLAARARRDSPKTSMTVLNDES
ncbi:MAG TPA: YtxH domain-containing protein [Acidimicrobiia bacterium]|nr:YtxH domain-containing protein [Acidimicrobiia bacterium]